MASPDLGFFRRHFGSQLREVIPQRLKDGPQRAVIDRVRLTFAGGQAEPASLIVKRCPPNSDYPHYRQDRERRFYETLAPELGVCTPRLIFAGADSADGSLFLVLEDLAGTHRFPDHPYRWTPDELRSVLSAYARLHTLSASELPPPSRRDWLLPPAEARWSPEAVAAGHTAAVRHGHWRPLAGLDSLVAWAEAEATSWAGAPVTLLHNDVVPPNVGLPRDPGGALTILDWQDAGWGMAELDLAYLFTQPFDSGRGLERDQALSYYWAERKALEGSIPSPVERRARQRFSDAVLALSLVPVAGRAAAQPYPAGTYPARHWESLFGVLYTRLETLCAEVGV